MTFSWTPDFAVKIAHFDEQHKNLFKQIDTLDHAVQAGGARPAVEAALDTLVPYAVQHFKDEEAEMTKTKFDGFEAHKKVHDEFVAKVGPIYSTYKASGTMADPAGVVKFLKEWLVAHIKGMDQKYTAHLNANGVH